MKPEGITITQYMLPEGPIHFDTASAEQLDRIGELHAIRRDDGEPDASYRSKLLKALHSRTSYMTTDEVKQFFDPDTGKEFVQIDPNEIQAKIQHTQQVQDFLTALDKL
jgi:hypothetical protein